MKKIFRVLLAAILLSCLVAPLTAHAVTPYKTYTVDGYGYVTETQTAYTPLSAITKLDEVSFGTPMDMSLASDGLLYIADSGLKVILVATTDGHYVKSIGEGTLKMPTGVYVSDSGLVYVADKGAKAVFVFTAEGELVGQYGKPDSPIYGAKLDFKPIKVVANEAGTIYCICEGNTNGIVQISPAEGGTFLGYFGTNYTSLNPLQIVQRAILTDEQRAKLFSSMPSTPTNLSIDEKGLIYTVTQGQGVTSLKKLNIAGNNLIEPDAYDELCAAVATGNYENIYVASSDGYVYEYNEEGELLFVFGGRDDGRLRVGLCSKVEAIAVGENDNIYLLDSDKKQINVYEPTEFTDLLHEALYLYSKGRYTESKAPLTTVLEMNSLFDYANTAMGRAYFQEENYDEALRYSRLGKDWDGYSDAFWEIRNEWLRENIITIMGLIIVLIIVVKVLKAVHRKKDIFRTVIDALDKFKKKELISRLRYSFYFIRHPNDGCYGVKREGKTSLLCANILIGLFILVSIINKYYCGFLFKTIRDGRYEIFTDIGIVILVFVVLTACNYLVVTINNGEGTFKNLYSAYAYSLTPYIIITPFMTILSNVITYNESFLLSFGNVCMYAWMVILLFISLKEVNNYSVKETVKSIFLTAFTVLIGVLIVFIIYALCNQAIDFVTTLGREVVYRIEQ